MVPGSGDAQDADQADGRWWQRVSPPTAPQVFLAGAVVIWTWYFTVRSLNIHHALGTATYDSALYDQGMWSLSRFDAPFVTLMGRNLFGDHTSFVLLFPGPDLLDGSGAWIMFTAQSGCDRCGSDSRVPLRPSTTRLGVVGADRCRNSYLLHPAVDWTNLENFHPDAFLGVFVGFGDLRRVGTQVAVVRRLRRVVVAREGGRVVGDRSARDLGGPPARSANRAAHGLRQSGLHGGGDVRRDAQPDRRTDAQLVAHPFGGVRGLIDTAITNPTQLVEHLRSDDRPWYLVQMTAPFAWLFARLPDVALISGLVLFTNILSTFWYQYQIDYHYSLIAVPALAIGTVYAIGAMRDHVVSVRDRSVRVRPRPIAMGALAVATLVTAYLWAPVPWGRTPQFYGRTDNVYAVSARELLDLVPDDAVVSANYRLTPHLAYREEIYQFPVPFRVLLYGPDASMEGERLTERAEHVEFVMLPVNLDGDLVNDWLDVEDAFTEIARNDIWVLYERDRSVPLPD